MESMYGLIEMFSQHEPNGCNFVVFMVRFKVRSKVACTLLLLEEDHLVELQLPVMMKAWKEWKAFYNMFFGSHETLLAMVSLPASQQQKLDNEFL